MESIKFLKSALQDFYFYFCKIKTLFSVLTFIPLVPSSRSENEEDEFLAFFHNTMQQMGTYVPLKRAHARAIARPGW